MSKGATGVSPFGKECADLFWPQTRASSDDICISCGNLRYQGHDPECAFMRYTQEAAMSKDAAGAGKDRGFQHGLLDDLAPEMAALLRELEWAADELRCPSCGASKRFGHLGPDYAHPYRRCRLGALLDAIQ